MSTIFLACGENDLGERMVEGRYSNRELARDHVKVLGDEFWVEEEEVLDELPNWVAEILSDDHTGDCDGYCDVHPNGLGCRLMERGEI